ncbi:hypothetical protein PHPALM_30850 [Phytophthora palmivora]|uniref:Uncharacterized protein n=1 Tax=Phytophthora palmivora TaxID=4796 RepID=A0A2P4X447_9STRA|nr:hypothetical protein PHPALM_30850 [Phytophthora palmivora]
MSEGGRGFFCEEHEDWATINETACAGYKTDGTKCYRRVPDPQYPYCRTSHDPRVEYVDPQLFRLNGLRYQVLGTLVKRDGRDLYDPKRKIKKATSNDEVEHIGELQQVSFLLQFASFEDKEEQDDVVVFFRDDVVNQLSNLCLTSKDINARKCAAVTHSLEDIVKFSMAEYDQLDPKALHDIRASAFNVPIVATFTDRLRDEGLKRASTKAIRREMRPALRSWWYKCRDQGESPIYEQIGQSARQLCTILDLADGLGVD